MAINLQLGWPSPHLFAAAGLLSGAEAMLGTPAKAAEALVYGAHAGYGPLRESTAGWLTEVYRPQAGPVTAERICVTNGASGNLANILQKFTDPVATRRVFMAEPTYFLACPIFEDSGFQGRLRGVPEGVDGIDVAYLRKALEEAEAEAKAEAKAEGPPRLLKNGPNYPHIFRYVVYVVATFANPSGKTLSPTTRTALVELAREFDALVISDDVYDFLAWPANGDTEPAATPPRLVDVDRLLPGTSAYGNTLSNGSFSKILGPGVRVGWAECMPLMAEHLANVGSSSSGGQPAHMTSTFVDHLLRSRQLQNHLTDVLIPTYRRRYSVLMAAIADHLAPLGVRVEAAPPGGFFAYLRLPPDLPPARTVAALLLQKQSLRVAFGHMFVVAGDPQSTARAEDSEDGFARCVRLCWAWHEEDKLLEGIQRMAAGIVDTRERMAAGEDVGKGLTIGIR